jgi:hypothetical protein
VIVIVLKPEQFQREFVELTIGPRGVEHARAQARRKSFERMDRVQAVFISPAGFPLQPGRNIRTKRPPGKP